MKFYSLSHFILYASLPEYFPYWVCGRAAEWRVGVVIRGPSPPQHSLDKDITHSISPTTFPSLLTLWQETTRLLDYSPQKCSVLPLWPCGADGCWTSLICCSIIDFTASSLHYLFFSLDFSDDIHLVPPSVPASFHFPRTCSLFSPSLFVNVLASLRSTCSTQQVKFIGLFF
ncbi:hypothetical protein E2C01_072403 [Portunus trituberculatus]|uniref:Uncharacterized protein n=1 Tax=Portunus trituberculatus TaxID=210409 RepID=A0A5B7IB41_PORTR|nr:hypothetical protein [Portunus trituberculatus]